MKKANQLVNRQQRRKHTVNIHVLLVAPLGARHVAESRADQHQGGISVRECPHHASAAADLTVQPLDHIVGADARPMLAGKVTIKAGSDPPKVSLTNRNTAFIFCGDWGSAPTSMKQAGSV